VTTTLLRVEVPDVVLVHRRDQRDPSDDVDPVLAKSVHLGRIVRHESDTPHVQRAQHLGRAAVVARVLGKAEEPVGLERVEAVFLERVGPELVGEPDASALLSEVEQDARVVPGQGLERGRELVAAVAAERSQHVTREALRVKPRGDRLLAGDLSMHQGHMLLPGRVGRERDGTEVAKPSGKLDLRDDGHFAPPMSGRVGWAFSATGRGGLPIRNAHTPSPLAWQETSVVFHFRVRLKSAASRSQISG